MVNILYFILHLSKQACTSFNKTKKKRFELFYNE